MSQASFKSFSVRRRWLILAAVFFTVLAAQLWLVASAGNDIPFYDQWDVEGRWLYPAWREGRLGFTDLFRLHNEHRIFWTHLLNLDLIAVNGQWDPFVQIVAGAALHSLAAATVAYFLTKSLSAARGCLMAVAVAAAFLPVAAWHNALWGFQSQVYFSILFGVPALAWLSRAETRWRGAACALAAMVAMGPGGLLPFVLLGLLGLRIAESRSVVARWKGELILLLVLGGLGLWGQIQKGNAAPFHTASTGVFLGTWLRLLAWPHSEQPLAAFVLNLPMAYLLGRRLADRRSILSDENPALAIGLWAMVIAAAAAWTRGEGDELATGIPSRYVDFLVLLPLVNGWCLLRLANETRSQLCWAARIWVLFVLIGWVGFSTEMMRRVILPLTRNRDRPAQLTRAFQLSRDPTVFIGQPRLLVPHPDLGSVQAVLDDPRMVGLLPPSLQPERPQGPLSRAVRWLLGRKQPFENSVH